jgi:hypothetical protein
LTPAGAHSEQAPAPAPAPAPRPSKDDLAREQLEPLREGERPRAVTVAAVVAALIAVANLIGIAVAGSEAGGALPFAALMTIAAVGMWRTRYWAVLGFQAILALTTIYALLFLLISAGSALEVLLALVAVGVTGTLFWFLVKALARIQMPQRRTG